MLLTFWETKILYNYEYEYETTKNLEKESRNRLIRITCLNLWILEQ